MPLVIVMEEMTSIYHYLGKRVATEVTSDCHAGLFTMTIQLEKRRRNCTAANWARSTILPLDFLHELLRFGLMLLCA